MATRIFTGQTPAIVNGNDGTDYTLATRFSRSNDGSIVGGAWYFSNPLPSGPVDWVLYDDASEAELARVTFVDPVAGAWNDTPDLETPVSYTADTLLKAAIHTPDGYTATANFFATDDLVNDDITAPGNAGGAEQNNGWLGNVDEYPGIISGNAACFFADVRFAGETAEADGEGVGYGAGLGSAASTKTAAATSTAHGGGVSSATGAKTAAAAGLGHAGATGQATASKTAAGSGAGHGAGVLAAAGFKVAQSAGVAFGALIGISGAAAPAARGPVVVTTSAAPRATVQTRTTTARLEVSAR